MIPVKAYPEPSSFDQTVRQPGLNFLQEVPNPTKQQWANRSYWRKVLPEMRISYDRICSYCAHWIPESTGNDSVDHFVPKARNPSLAYEWTNFRYASTRFNSRKHTKEIVDPFTISYQWFVIDFKSLFIHANDELEPKQKQLVEQTIEILKLNTDDDLVSERWTWAMEYFQRQITFDFLSRRYPFIAYEMQRQHLVDPE